VLAMSLDGLDSPRLDEKDCWLRHWGSGSPRDSVGRFGSSVGLESAEPAKSAKSAAGADYESGRFMVQGLTEKTVGPDKWAAAAAAMPTGGNRQRRFVQLQVRQGEWAAQIFRRTWAGRWTVQAMQENSSRGHAEETALV
jgi:hypothetical protein